MVLNNMAIGLPCPSTVALQILDTATIVNIIGTVDRENQLDLVLVIPQNKVELAA